MSSIFLYSMIYYGSICRSISFFLNGYFIIWNNCNHSLTNGGCLNVYIVYFLNLVFRALANDFSKNSRSKLCPFFLLIATSISIYLSLSRQCTVVLVVKLFQPGQSLLLDSRVARGKKPCLC